jgi:hypothetical protein
MYERPQLKRFGTMRELTKSGWDGDADGWFLQNIGVVGDNLNCRITHCS